MQQWGTKCLETGRVFFNEFLVLLLPKKILLEYIFQNVDKNCKRSYSPEKRIKESKSIDEYV